MATTSTMSNRYLLAKSSGEINEATDDYKAVLLNTSFVFDRDTHDTYADISSSEISGVNGYTTGGMDLTKDPPGVTRDDSNDWVVLSFADLVITPSGGNVGPFGAVAIIDDTHSDKVVMGVVDLGEDVTATSGAPFTLTDILKRHS